MPLDSVWKLLVNGASEVAVLGLALLVILRLGTLAINRYFEYLQKVMPLHERLVAAVEKLTGVAERFEQKIVREQNLIATSIRALWDEWEERKAREAARADRAEAHNV
jgi:hypothetical protein